VAISGNAIVVGAPGNNLGIVGFVTVFRRTGDTWAEEDRVVGSVSGTNGFGAAVSIDGDVIAVGTPGFNDDVAYVFRRSGLDWVEEAVLRPAVDGPLDYFGQSIDVAGDTVVVGAGSETSGGRGINVPDADEDATFSGAAYVFREVGGRWSQEAFIKSSNSDSNDQFGWDVDLEGDLLAVGANREASSSAGVAADQSDNSAAGAGAVYLFRRDGSAWSQVLYVKASNPDASDEFGGLALSAQGLIISALREDSDATGLAGGQGDSASTEQSGAFYVFR
jgi:hypothetical protein